MSRRYFSYSWSRLVSRKPRRQRRLWLQRLRAAETLEVRMMLHAGPHFVNGIQVGGDYVAGRATLPSHNDPKAPDDPAATPAAGETVESSPVPLSDTFKLHSNPTANHTIFLDFDGHVTTGTSWNSSSNPSIVTAAYDPSGDGAAFNNTELDRIQKIWQRVAEDFAPFNVNVTTEDPGAAALSKSGSGDTKWGVRVVITPTDWSNCGCGGHAYIGSFNDSQDEPVFVYNTGEIGVAAASSHEVGHALYLSHDGLTTGDAYYDGHGSGENSWGPIMGSGYYSNVTTWDTGQYYQTNNSGSGANYSHGANDYTVITVNNGFGYLADDHGGSLAAAADLTVLGTNASNPGLSDVGSFGIIGQSTDLDFFRFTTGSGAINLTIDSYYSRSYTSTGGGSYSVTYQPTPVGSATVESQGSNLDVLATLRDVNGNIVATSNPVGLSAAFTNLNLAAGTYYLSVDGTGFGNWAANPPTGYSEVVSLGQYYVRGTIVNPTPTISLNQAVYAPGEVIGVTFSNGPGNAADWIGIYTDGATPGSDSSVAWYYTNNTHTASGSLTSGVVTIDAGAGPWPLPTGNYFAGFFENDYTELSPRVSFPVTFAPTAVNDTATTGEDSAVIVSVLANDSDSDGGTLSVSSKTNGTKGTVAINADGTVTYTPNPNANGGDTFTYTISDGQGGTATAAVAVTINPVNDAPLASNDSASTTLTAPVTVNVKANDSDADGDALTVVLESNPANGAAVVNANGTITYTANTGFTGTDPFGYKVLDGVSESNVATVTVTVSAGTKFFVVDNTADKTFRYRADGASMTQSSTGTGNTNPVGVAASPDGSTLWVLDGNKKVFVYGVSDASMTLLGSWTGGSLKSPKGISVSGADVWIVDANADKIFRYAGAATRLSGTATATQSFALISGNKNPQDLVTDGTTIWVTQSNSPDKVFVYQASNGANLGSWTIDPANSSPVGITLDPTNASNSLWIVDNTADRVFEYANGRARTSGSQLAGPSFALNSGNTNAQGIADPLTGDVAPAAVETVNSPVPASTEATVLFATRSSTAGRDTVQNFRRAAFVADLLARHFFVPIASSTTRSDAALHTVPSRVSDDSAVDGERLEKALDDLFAGEPSFCWLDE